jgi:hypothetical protein
MLVRVAQAARWRSTQEGDDQVEAKEVGHPHCISANAGLIIKSTSPPIPAKQSHGPELLVFPTLSRPL